MAISLLRGEEIKGRRTNESYKNHEGDKPRQKGHLEGRRRGPHVRSTFNYIFKIVHLLAAELGNLKVISVEIMWILGYILITKNNGLSSIKIGYIQFIAFSVGSQPQTTFLKFLYIFRTNEYWLLGMGCGIYPGI